MTGPHGTASRRRVGRVIAGSGAQHLVLIERQAEAGRPLCAGDVLVVGVGRQDAMTGAHAPLCVASVTAMTVPAPQTDGDTDEIRIAEVELHGTLDDEGAFARGVDRTPALGDAVCTASTDDLTRLYAGAGAPIGTITVEPGIAASADPDQLARGFGVIGAAGSGKSCTLAVLTRALLRARAPIRPVLLDTHDEFARSFGRAARVVRPGRGFLPHWLLTFEEFCWVLSIQGGPLSPDERSLLEEAVPAARIRMLQRAEEPTGVPVGLDTPLPYRVTDAISFLDRTVHADAQRGGAAYKRLRGRLAAASADPRLAPVFGGLSANDTLPTLLADLFGMAAGSPPMTVLQLGRLGLGLDRLFAAVLCRLARALGEGTNGRERVLVLLEDAERFAPRQAGGEGVAGAEALSRAAVLDLAASQEASGAALGLVTARPSLVHEHVLRAVPTLFVGRLPSEAERDCVSGVLPEGSAAAVASAGTQRARAVVALGRGVPAPGRYTLAELPPAAVPRRVGSAPPNLAREELAAALIRSWRFGGSGEEPVDPDAVLGAAPRPRTVPAA